MNKKFIENDEVRSYLNSLSGKYSIKTEPIKKSPVKYTKKFPS
jgi:hypothetical protein